MGFSTGFTRGINPERNPCNLPKMQVNADVTGSRDTPDSMDQHGYTTVRRGSGRRLGRITGGLRPVGHSRGHVFRTCSFNHYRFSNNPNSPPAPVYFPGLSLFSPSNGHAQANPQVRQGTRWRPRVSFCSSPWRKFPRKNVAGVLRPARCRVMLELSAERNRKHPTIPHPARAMSAEREQRHERHHPGTIHHD